MNNFYELKILSKEQLKNNWKLPILFSAISLALSYYASLSNNNSIILSLAILLISFYFTKVVINVVEGNANGSINVPFKHMLRTFGLGILYSLIYFSINMLALFATSFMLFSGSISLIAGLLMVIPLVLAFIIFNLVAMCYLSMSIYLVYSKDYKVFKSFKYSILYLKGNLMKTIWLVITFIPWMLLGFITFGLGFIYIMPYLEIIFTNYCIDLEGAYRKVA